MTVDLHVLSQKPFGENWLVGDRVALELVATDGKGDPVDLSEMAVEARYNRYDRGASGCIRELAEEGAEMSVEDGERPELWLDAEEPGLYALRVQVTGEAQGAEQHVFQVEESTVESW